MIPCSIYTLFFYKETISLLQWVLYMSIDIWCKLDEKKKKKKKGIIKNT